MTDALAPTKLLIRRRAAGAWILLLTGCAGLPASRTTEADAPVPAAVEQAGEVAPGDAPVTMADLDRRTADLFGDFIRTDAPLAAAEESGGGDAAPSWDIDVHSYETFDRVRFYVSMFTGYARDQFVERLDRGTRYESMIRSALRDGDLPEDMYYLALVESGFNPNAYSRAAAVGMWQFMASTGRGMGLRVDWWVDERRDPIRSTHAAVRFLRGLREQFGSMYLAAAAYNGGPGRIARGLSRYSDELEGTTGDDLFFMLAEKKYLRNETREYVPQLIAAALVAKEPARYGIAITPREAFAYDSVRVGPHVALATVARASGATIPLIQELNPQILRGMTPPSDSMTLRIPPGSRSRFDSTFDTLSARAAPVRWVKAGRASTWASLARNTGVSARAVSTWNPRVKASRSTGRITPGTRILIPTPEIVAAALSVPNPSIERYGRASSRTYVVRRGDNLSIIATRFHTTPAAIMRRNRLKKALIFPGQELSVR